MNTSYIDLFNNPMVDAAKKALTAEQKEEYKKIGEYMYENKDYVKTGLMPKNQSQTDIANYAYVGLKSGMDPKDLSKAELVALSDVMGENWYESLGIDKSEIPECGFNMKLPESEEDLLREMQKNCKSRQEKRACERRLQKLLKKAKTLKDAK